MSLNKEINMTNIISKINSQTQAYLQDLGLLGLRIFLAYEFGFAGLTKLQHWQVPDWFAQLDFPSPLNFSTPQLNWNMAGLMEITLAALLALGLMSRLCAIGLLFITYVAIYTVHFDLGWAGWNQIETEAGYGFKLPLMLAVMLFTVLTQGGGKYSADRYITNASFLRSNALAKL